MARQRVAALTKAEGKSAIESDPKITGTARRDGRRDRAMLVELSGEFDILYQKVLENVLSRCLTSGRPTLVDLSRVTFMDSQCVRELAIHYQLGGGSLALCDPSREVELSVAACDLEGCIDFVHTTARRRFRVSAVLARALPDSGLVGERERLLAMVQGRCGAKEPSDLRHRSGGPEA